MSTAQRQLLETLSGHIALLKESHPRKANTRTAIKAKKYIQSQLRLDAQRPRMAA